MTFSPRLITVEASGKMEESMLDVAVHVLELMLLRITRKDNTLVVTCPTRKDVLDAMHTLTELDFSTITTTKVRRRRTRAGKTTEK